MATIVTRQTGPEAKNAALTNQELDQNLININTAKLELAQIFSSAAANSIPYFNSGKTLTSSSSLLFDGTNITAGLIGNASTATTLQTARNINGVSFNGSADITVADSTKLPLAGGTVTGGLSAPYIGVNNTTNTNGYGISLYNGATAGEPTYGIMFQGTATFGNHGAVSNASDWATYFTMNNDNGRGWIFRKAGIGNTSSISAGGVAQFDGSVRSPIFYDSNDTAYYVDPASNGTRAAYLNGNLWINPKSEAYGEGIVFNMPTQAVWGGLRWYRNGSAASYAGNWAFGYFGNESNNDIGFHNGSNGWRLDHSFNNTVTGSVRSPIFYDNNDTGYYLDPASTTTSLQIAGAIEQGSDFAHPNIEWSASGGSTGMVIFKLPGTSGNYGMVHMVFDYYEYVSGRTATVIIGGHNWSTSWYETGCNVIGNLPKEVRLGYVDGQYCVVFGVGGSSWSYGTIRLRKIHNASFYNNIMNLGGAYAVSQVTSATFTNITGDLRQFYTPKDSYAYAYRGHSNVAGTGEASFHPAGIYSTGTNWLYGSIITNNNTINSGTGSISGSIFYDSADTAYYWDPGASSAHHFQTPSGYIRIGPQNSSHCHLTTDRSNFYFNADLQVHGTIRHYNDTNNRFDVGSLVLRSSSPTIYLRDTDHNTAMIHCNSNTFYVLRGGTDSESWGTVGSGWWPMQIDLTNNNASFGGSVTAAYSFYGQTFYERENSAYYCDPAGNSYLYGLILSGGSYFRPQNWIQLDSDYGIYWPNHYGAHIRPNTASTYTQIRLTGSKNSYGGIYDDYSAVNGFMYDSSGNGGVYREASGRWFTYYHVGNDCLGIGTSSTNSTWGIYCNKGLYAGSRVDATIYYDANDSGYYIDPNATTAMRTVGDWRANSHDWSGEFSGKIQYHANNWYFQAYNAFQFRNSSGSQLLLCDSGGNLTATGNVTAYSDIRLKKNVQTIQNPLSIVSRLRGVTFDWIETNKHSYGLIAQEVEEVLPELVQENVPDPNSIDRDKPVIKSVDYSKMVSVLIEAVKAQQQIIESQETRLQALETALTRLTA